MASRSTRLNPWPLDAEMIIPRLLPLLIVALLSSCGPTRTPLRLEPHDDLVRVHVENLGEYVSHITRIELTRHVGGDTVWRVESVGDSFEIYNFDLRVGINESNLPVSRGSACTVLPRADRFVLAPGESYDIRVCAYGWYMRCAKKRLVMPAAALEFRFELQH